MDFGLRCCQPACRSHPASLPVRIPAVESLLPASFSFTSRLRLALSLRLPPSVPSGSFHPDRYCPCWAHWRGHPRPRTKLAAIEPGDWWSIRQDESFNRIIRDERGWWRSLSTSRVVADL